MAVTVVEPRALGGWGFRGLGTRGSGITVLNFGVEGCEFSVWGFSGFWA